MNASAVLRACAISVACAAGWGVLFASRVCIPRRKPLLRSDDMDQAREYAGRIVALAGGKYQYRGVKALGKGLTHLRRVRLDTARHRCWNGSTVRYARAIERVVDGQSIIC